MNKSKLYLALAAAMALQVPSYSFAAEADTDDKPLTAKERAEAKKKALRESEENVIVIGGYAASEVAAVNMKQYADTISANLSAEDIGILPDQSIAESLQRLTGVAGNNQDGRSNTINVRGLGGGYTLTTLNGREIVSSFGSRSVNLSLYPGEAIRKAQVYKTSMSDSLEGGIGGVVNMETIKPLGLRNDIKTVSATINGNTNFDDVNYGDTYGKKLSGLFSHHFSDDLAIAIGAAYQNEPRYIESYKANEIKPSKDWDGIADNGPLGNGNDYAPTAHVFQTKKQDITRESIFATAQWQYSDELLITVDGLSSDYNYDQYMSSQIFDVWQDFQAEPGYGPTAYNEDNVLVQGSWSLNNIVNAPTNVFNRDATKAYGINFALDVSESTILEVDVSRSTSDRLYAWRSSWDKFGDGNIRHYMSFDHTDPNNPGFTYHGADVNGDGNLTNILNDGSYYQFTGLGNPMGGVISENKAVKIDLTVELDFDFFNQFKIGVRKSQNNKLEHHNAQTLDTDFLGAGFDITDYQAQIVGSRYDSFDNVHGLANAFFYAGNEILADYAGSIPDRVLTARDRAEGYDLTEDTMAIYLQTSFANDWMDGTFGVRYFKTELESTAEQYIPIVRRLGWGNNEYQLRWPSEEDEQTNIVNYSSSQIQILPTLNVNLRLIDDVVIRIGAGKAMIRPGISDLHGGMKIRSNVKHNTRFGDDWDAESTTLGRVGNPLLENIISTQADVSFEWYPNKTDFYALAFFHKDLDALYVGGFVSLPIENLSDHQGNDIEASLPLSQVQMGEGGSVSGAEVSFRKNMGFLSDYLEGLNISGNYMNFNSQAQQDYNKRGDNRWNPEDDRPQELLYRPLGWIDSTYNITFSYDITNKLSARYNINRQSEVAHGNRNNGEYFLRLPASIHSLSLRYKNGNYTIFGQVGNITDEFTRDAQLALEFFEAPLKNTLRQQDTLGISYYVGMNYRF